MDRAEAIMDRTAKKVEKSKGQAKVTYSRRRTWEEINSETVGAKPRPKFFSKEMEEEDDYVQKFYADDDEGMEDERVTPGGDGAGTRARSAARSSGRADHVRSKTPERKYVARLEKVRVPRENPEL